NASPPANISSTPQGTRCMLGQSTSAEPSPRPDGTRNRATEATSATVASPTFETWVSGSTAPIHDSQPPYGLERVIQQSDVRAKIVSTRTSAGFQAPTGGIVIGAASFSPRVTIHQTAGIRITTMGTPTHIQSRNESI